MPMHVFNVYGPRVEKHLFWNDIECCGLVDIKSIVIGGNLNFSLGARES